MVTHYEILRKESLKDESVDDFINQRSEILKTVLGVFLQEIKTRLGLRRNNLRRIDEDINRAEDLMGSMRTMWNSGGGYNIDKESFLKLQNVQDELRKEKREQEVSCWSDVTNVMNNFLLNKWEAHQQTEARARLMNSGGLNKIIEGTFQREKEEFLYDRPEAQGNLYKA